MVARQQSLAAPEHEQRAHGAAARARERGEAQRVGRIGEHAERRAREPLLEQGEELRAAHAHIAQDRVDLFEQRRKRVPHLRVLLRKRHAPLDHERLRAALELALHVERGEIVVAGALSAAAGLRSPSRSMSSGPVTAWRTASGTAGASPRVKGARKREKRTPKRSTWFSNSSASSCETPA